MHQIKVRQRQGIPLVCDFSLEQDYAYGENNLIGDELSSFREIYQVTMSQLQTPELLIFLDCPVDILLRRITARGRTSERTINTDYLRTTIAQLKRRLKDTGREIVVMNSLRSDLRKNGEFPSFLSDLFHR